MFDKVKDNIIDRNLKALVQSSLHQCPWLPNVRMTVQLGKNVN